MDKLTPDAIRGLANPPGSPIKSCCHAIIDLICDLEKSTAENRVACHAAMDKLLDTPRRPPELDSDAPTA
jgi:hypothetical protein